MQEFRVNKYLTLKLENNQTFIYINNKRFLQCIRLILEIPKNNITDYDQINSIDEAAAVYKTIHNNRIMEGDQSHLITPDQEFLGHSSNIQAWAENKYDTRILHSKISFPLLRQLTKAGDPLALKVFKEEIGKRFMAGYEPVKEYLKVQGYLDFLNKDELEAIGAADYKPKTIFRIHDILAELLGGGNPLNEELLGQHNEKLQEIIKRLKEDLPVPISFPGPFNPHNRWRRMGGGAVA